MPSGRLDLVDLGYDYFLVRFKTKEDLDQVLREGSWFIRQHFLSIKPWQLEFSASNANLSQVVVRVRFPSLPIEFYDTEVLKKIGSSIGPVLRIDSHTASNARGRYARLYVQVNLDNPLITTILIGKYKQWVMYEGIHAPCFACGRLGHKKESCQYVGKGPPQPPTSTPTNTHQNETDLATKTPNMATISPTTESDTFGPWLLVFWRKHNVKKSPQAPNPSHQPPTNTSYSPIKHGKPLLLVTLDVVMSTDFDSQSKKGKWKLIASPVHH